MTRRKMSRRKHDDTARQPNAPPSSSERHDAPRQPAWQFYVTLFVALGALVALVMFVYGFYAVRSR